MLYSKSEDWKYEKELRLIKSDINSELDRKYYYDKNDIRVIYFGVNASEELINPFKSILKQTFYFDDKKNEKIIPYIQLYMGLLAENKFNLSWVGTEQ
jgi:hypothetical protein